MQSITEAASRLPDDLVAVVPCYNAGTRVQGVIQGLLPLVESVVVVDDGSTDGCIEPLRDLPLRLVSFPENRGKGFALKAGYLEALADPKVECVAVLDADGQHDPAELPRLYEAFHAEEADLVIGSRCFDGADVPWPNRFGNRLTVHLTRWLLGRHLPDTQSGYRLLSRRFLEAVLPEVAGGRYEFEMQLLGKAILGDYRLCPVPIKTIYERGNPSSHFRKVVDSWRVFRTLLRAARDVRRR